jgi:uncharacterized repeat protein (TIGR03837 family)
MARHKRWDIFCTVVDNYGDIGVCWRLARQLAAEYGLHVRLWVDDLASFAQLAPALDPTRDAQSLCGVEIRRWLTPFAATTPAEVVIEAFACEVPAVYVAAMALQDPKPLWINLEYLSAEAWVEDHHGLPSPHPQLPLTKYFFFPGFTEKTGGLLREAELITARSAFQNDAQEQAIGWRSIGVEPVPRALTVSLFAYPTAPLAPLLAAWIASPMPIICLVPDTPLATIIGTALGYDRLKPGQRIIRGTLTLVGVPFLAQPEYDKLLWACDLNFVRGEDSFVRAQWAAKPFVWHIYPQSDAVHRVKLEAFIAHYCQGAPAPLAQALAAFWRAWNTADGEIAAAWPLFAAALPQLADHARHWAARRAMHPDLATQLVKFSRNPL